MDDTLSSLQAIVGPEHVSIDEPARSAASVGWYPVETKEKIAAGGVPPRLVRAVVSPGSAAEVAGIVRWANATGTPLIPVGGSSNTVGATQPEYGGAAVSAARLQALSWDEESLLVTAGAGWSLGALEERLNAHRYTLGHFPHSLHLATVGGSIATDAVGALAGRYGRQSDQVVALEAVLPDGEIVRTSPAPGAPGAPAGPDWGRLLLGSEGTLGIVTEATLRMWPIPDVRAWAVFTLPDLPAAFDALRLIHRTDSRPAGVRLFDAAAAEELAARHSLPAGAPLLLLCFEGDELVQTGHYQMAHAVCQKVGGTERSPEIGEAWFEERLQTSWMAPNARAGGLADVLSLAAPWSRVRAVHDAVRAALDPLATHLSVQVGWAGPTGAALDFLVQAQAEPATAAASIDLHRRMVAAAMDASLAAGGSISHHYGVGIARRDGMAREQGEAGMRLLERIKDALDPNHILNPGKLGVGRR